MSDYPFEFDAKVTLLDFGKFSFAVVLLPKRLHAKLPFKQFPRLRVDGEVNGIRFNGAFQPMNGTWHLMLSRRMLKLCGLEIGARAHIAFEVADQDAVDVPYELLSAIERSDALQAWEQLTPGKRRSYVCRLSGAKLPATREKRIEEIIAELHKRSS